MLRDCCDYRLRLTGASHLDKRTALLMALIYRDPNAADSTNEWCMRIMSDATMGRTAQQLTPALSQWIRNHPPTKLAPGPPGGARMLAKAPTSSAAIQASAGNVAEQGPIVMGQVVEIA